MSAERATRRATPRRRAPAESRREKRVRVILPSGRVAEFRIPRVRDVLEIREESLSAAGTFTPPGEMPPADTSTVSGAMGRLALRSLLCAITESPARPVTRGGVILDTVRARAEAEAREQLLEDADEHGKPVDELAVERLAQKAGVDAYFTAIDDQATARAAVLVPVDDDAWNDGLLARLPESYIGSPESADWEQLHAFARQLVATSLSCLEGASSELMDSATIADAGLGRLRRLVIILEQIGHVPRESILAMTPEALLWSAVEHLDFYTYLRARKGPGEE